MNCGLIVVHFLDLLLAGLTEPLSSAAPVPLVPLVPSLFKDVPPLTPVGLAHARLQLVRTVLVMARAPTEKPRAEKPPTTPVLSQLRVDEVDPSKTWCDACSVLTPHTIETRYTSARPFLFIGISRFVLTYTAGAQPVAIRSSTAIVIPPSIEITVHPPGEEPLSGTARAGSSVTPVHASGGTT